MTKTHSLVQAAAILGLHRNTLAGWIDRGCPVVTRADRARGVEWELSIPKVFAWRTDALVKEAVAGYQTEQGHVTKDEADRRKAVAQAIVAEVEAAEALKSVVARFDVELLLADFCQALRAGMSGSGSTIAGRAAIMSDPNEIRDLCEAVVNKAFRAAEADLNERWAGGGSFDDDGDHEED